MRPALAVIIPTLNEAQTIGTTLDRVARLRIEHEVIVVDGGSDDDTAGIAQWCDARVFTTPADRAAQFNRGVEAATAEILWFLRADTLPPADAGEHILNALADCTVAGGRFKLRYTGKGWPPGPRLRRFGVRDGAAGLFVRKSIYTRAGGLNPHPLFGYFSSIRHMRRYGRFVTVAAVLETGPSGAPIGARAV